jgi:DNA processing protein
MDEERRARMQVSRITEPGDPDACRLVRDFSAAALVTRLREGRLPHPKAVMWAERLASVDVDGIARAAERVGARYIVPGDDEWPVELGDLGVLDPADSDRRAGEPFGLWVRGPLSLGRMAPKAVAIVGARASTEYGNHVAGAVAAGCAARGHPVVSGGAYGIDISSHRGALAVDGQTVSVLASGIDRLYPAGNARVLAEVAQTGLLVSEAAPGCSPTRSRFLVRNRLIAALGRGTVVVEAALRSGSLNTARWARDLGRVVMGVPGPVTSMMSAGVHALLRSPESVLVTDADEVLELIAPVGTEPAPVKTGPARPVDVLDEVAMRVLDATPVVAAASTASIAAIAELSPSQAHGVLDRLERQGFVIRTGSGWRLPPRGTDVAEGSAPPPVSH